MSKKTKIKRGDTVQVITGPRADKGKRGEVIRVLPKENRDENGLPYRVCRKCQKDID